MHGLNRINILVIPLCISVYPWLIFFWEVYINTFGRRLRVVDTADSLRSLRYVLGREEGYVATDGHGLNRIKSDKYIV